MFFKITSVTLLLRLRTLACCMMLVSIAHAAERLNLAHMSFTQLQNQMQLRPSNSLVTVQTDFLRLHVHVDEQKTEHTRTQQSYQGIPIFGSFAIFHRKHLKHTTQVQMTGYIYQKLYEDLGNRPANFVEKAAKLLKSYSQSFAPENILEQSIQPIVYIDKNNTALWAYKIQMHIQSPNGLPSQPNAIISEQTGAVLQQWDGLTTLQEKVYGIGFGGNMRSKKYQYGKDKPFLSLARDPKTGRCFLTNEHSMVVDMKHRTKRPNTPMTFLCAEDNPYHTYWTGYANDGYDEVNGSYSVSNDALYFGELVKKMYHTRYNVEMLQEDQQPMQIIFRVHFGNYLANSFWDGKQITLGDGDETFYPQVTLSIITHELSHGFTQQHSGLIYTGQSGAINESFSDMAAQTAEYYSYGKSSWRMAADALKNESALRWFEHPHQDGLSIEHANDYRNDMDVHFSSGVYNHLFYLLATHSNWDPLKAFHVMIKANMDYWTPTTNFDEGACGILAACRDLNCAENDVKDALQEVTINYQDC